MNDLKDNVAATLRQWSTELTTALCTAGLGVTYESHKGSSSMRLGKLIVKKPDTDIRYHVDFERKLIVQANQRVAICGIEVYNPDGGLHVHITKFSPATVAKIVGYAIKTIETKHARELADEARRGRGDTGLKIYQREFNSWPKPDWVRLSPNVESDADVGTFRLMFSDHLREWPLARLTPAQAKAVIDSIRAVTCDHKFVDSNVCLKCGWRPPVVDTWQPASVPVPADLQSTPMQVKMLLLAIEGREQPVRGYFMGGLVNEFYMEGSPSQWKPTHWMRMPDMPTTSSK